MKKFSETELAILFFVATAIMAVVPKNVISNKVGAGMDALLPTPNYTMIGNNLMRYDSLRFAKPGVEFELMDLSFGNFFQMLLRFIIPTSIANRFLSQSYDADQTKGIYGTLQRGTWTQSVDILDARTMVNDFNRTGFDLITDDAFSTFDWDNIASSAVQKDLHDMMAPIISKYYPNATRFSITPPIRRNAFSLKAVNSPHVDYVPDDEEREAFYKENEIPAYQKTMQCLMGRCSNKSEELDVILGVWVPTMNTPVCDKPLAVLDSSSSDFHDSTPITMALPSMKLFGKTHKQMFSIMNYKPEQKWYYYSYQTPSEMLLFHHYNRDKTNVWGNAHSSFLVSGCGSEYEPRNSIEMRVGVFFEKKSKLLNA